MRAGRAARVANALVEWNEPLTADELHEKYCKMDVSPFVFYRGTAHLYWSDFADDWHLNQFGNRRTRTWLQGDGHAENMGAFNDQEGNLVYGLNDFDESFIGDYQYDLWRFAVQAGQSLAMGKVRHHFQYERLRQDAFRQHPIQ